MSIYNRIRIDIDLYKLYDNITTICFLVFSLLFLNSSITIENETYCGQFSEKIKSPRIILRQSLTIYAVLGIDL